MTKKACRKSHKTETQCYFVKQNNTFVYSWDK